MAKRKFATVEDYEDDHRVNNAARSRRSTKTGQNIAAELGEDCANWPRRKAGEHDLRLFADTYFSDKFYLPHAPDHLESYRKIQTIVLGGGQHAWAEPRGSGKTTRAIVAAIWALLYGHHHFVSLIAATADTAKDELIEAIKVHLETNELLLEDFRWTCLPIRLLDGTGRKAGGQHIDGARTCIVIKKERIVLPTVAGSKSSGAIVCAAGLLGRVRGMSQTSGTGIHRPSLVLVDDPQTDASADSKRQCQTRERKITNAVLGLAGPGKKISLLMPLTVIAADDMADRVLDRARYPEFQGVRIEALKSFPKNEGLWRKYADMRADCLRADQPITEATEFYRDNREAMDDGAVVYWPERFNPDEISAVQNLMSLYYEAPERFWAEMQNRPKDPTKTEGHLTVDDLVLKVSGVGRALVPVGTAQLVAFIDCHGSLLYYGVAAVQTDFTGSIIEYGAFPEQRRAHWNLRDAQPTLQTMFKGAGPEAALLAGLTGLTNELLAREWGTETGQTTMRISRCGIDAGWSTDEVHDFCRRSVFSPILLPALGRPFGPSATPISAYQQRAGDQLGTHWKLSPPQNNKRGRQVTVDTNFWKTNISHRFKTKLGDKGSWSFFQAEPRTHRMIAEHLTAEFVANSTDEKRTVDDWKVKPNRDNHLFDVCVGLGVIASVQGITWGQPAIKKGTVRWSDVYKEKQKGKTA